MCFSWIVLIGGFLFAMVTLLRWFEQVTDAVDEGAWNKVGLLLVAPFFAWAYESRLRIGRPVPAPRHEPVRGFGLNSKASIAPAAPAPATAPEPAPLPRTVAGVGSDQPPPGTPKEFLDMPQIPPKAKVKRPPIDPEKLARLKQKMREQGMLDEEDS